MQQVGSGETSTAPVSAIEEPRNGWANICATLAGDASPQLPSASSERPPEQASAASTGAALRGSASLPVRTADPLAALNPFGDIASWASLDSRASPGEKLCLPSPQLVFLLSACRLCVLLLSVGRLHNWSPLCVPAVCCVLT